MRILLVEDDSALGLAVRDYLLRESNVVDWVQRLGAARACLPGDYVCVVLDLGLPDGDGLSLLPALRALPEPPAVLILTARDRLSDLSMRALGRGALDVHELYVEERLRTLSLTIAAGTSQIQRNILGERVLGLPRERQWPTGAEGATR